MKEKQRKIFIFFWGFVRSFRIQNYIVHILINFFFKNLKFQFTDFHTLKLQSNLQSNSYLGVSIFYLLQIWRKKCIVIWLRYNVTWIYHIFTVGSWIPKINFSRFVVAKIAAQSSQTLHQTIIWIFLQIINLQIFLITCSSLKKIVCKSFFFSFQVLTYQNGTKVVNEIISGNGGCPYEKSWCRDTPKLHFAQFLTAATLVGIGYPIAAVLLSTLYSKIIGPFPQV